MDIEYLVEITGKYPTGDYNTSFSVKPVLFPVTSCLI